MQARALVRLSVILATVVAASLSSQSTFVQWETAHVHPLDMTPNGNRLLAVNTPDCRLEVFDLTSGSPVHTQSIQVGVDPVTVRALTNDRAWTANEVSDSISVVDLVSGTLVDTIQTPDEPSDIVFTNVGGGGTSGYAWVSCAQPNLVARFDLANLAMPPTIIPIVGEDPKAMVAGPGGVAVYVAIHTSGNDTTILSSGNGLLPDIVSDPGGPHGGTNPPPNSGASFVPPINPALPTPPPVGLIVRKDAAGRWMDDNNGDWTSYVSGAQAPQFGRIQGWDLWDHDVARIDTSTLAVTYAKGCMNIVMAIAMQGAHDGAFVTVVGTDATNEIRFEPNLKGTFVRVIGALVEPNAPTTIGKVDLNPLLVASGYSQPTLPQSTRDQSLGDPRAIAWDSSGSIGWVAGMGSNNVARIDAGGNRFATIEVGSGPTGLVVDEPRLQLYVLNRFGSSVSVIDAINDIAISETPFHDPTPLAVKHGRKHLYDTHRTSGLGQASCASCHVNGTIDNLSWDLGNPAGDMKTVHGRNIEYLLTPFIDPANELHHPMKGPMFTQTLQDIIGKEPFHWRGDRKGIEEFNSAFEGLLGDDEKLSATEMQEFEDFLASIWFPPNPFRQKDNQLSTSVDLTGLNLHYHPAGLPPVPLTTGDARHGFDLFMPTAGIKQDGFHCVTCHTNPTGVGPDLAFDGTLNSWVSLAAGAHGEAHTVLTGGDPNSQRPFKIPQLRNIHKKTGFDLQQTMNTAGFGYEHDGAVDTISHFISLPFVHTLGNEAQDVADLSALMLSYSGTGFPPGSLTGFDNPPGPAGKSSHAGVGFQWTVKQGNPLSQFDANILSSMLTIQAASPADIGIVVKQNQLAGGQKGLYYLGNFIFQTDAMSTTIGIVPLLGSIGPGTEATFTFVPGGTEVRMGVDRDGDGFFDADEVSLATDPANPRSVPPGGAMCTLLAPAAPSGVGGIALSPYQTQVNWTDNSANETGFAVERSWSNSPQWELVAEVAANVTAFADASVAPATGYSYRVRAFNCGGDSAASLPSAVVTTPVLPAAVTCHVHAIDLQLQAIPGTPPQVFAYGTVNVVDDQGRNVKGAGVNLTITGPSSGNTFAVTNDQGQARFDSLPVTSGTPPWVFTVQSIVSNGSLTVIYDATANVVTSAQVP